MTEDQLLTILKKIVNGDVTVYTRETSEYPGLGLDHSWIHLTEEEAIFVKSLQG